jgi:hypothetical protein
MSKSWLEEHNKALEKRVRRTQILDSYSDFELLRKGKDILRVKRTNFPKCTPEDFLFMAVGKSALILWGTGVGSQVDEYYVRVIKIPLFYFEDKAFEGGQIAVPDYTSGPFFELKEKSFTLLHDAGLLW